MEFPTINLNKNKLERQIKAWLVRFGERDNDGFSFHLENFYIYLSHVYDLDGSQNYERFDICSGKDWINGLTEEQLQEIFNELIKIQNELNQ